MKVLSFFMVLIFSTTSFASNPSDVKSIIDDLNYSLSVEWDQKDLAFYDDQLDLYTQKILALGIFQDICRLNFYAASFSSFFLGFNSTSTI
jgi:hypothetical protein